MTATCPHLHLSRIAVNVADPEPVHVQFHTHDLGDITVELALTPELQAAIQGLALVAEERLVAMLEHIVQHGHDPLSVVPEDATSLFRHGPCRICDRDVREDEPGAVFLEDGRVYCPEHG